MKKYIGSVLNIIYEDRFGKMTKRQIHVHAIRGSKVRAYCITSGAFRTFDSNRILAFEPARRLA